jgi:hypothetical protein
MLFILVMDVLNSLVTKAGELGLLQQLLIRGGGQQILLYADDVVLYLTPNVEELGMLNEFLRIFWVASGLVTNFSKCSVTSIQCQQQELMLIQDSMSCNVIDFPCKYLGYLCR